MFCNEVVSCFVSRGTVDVNVSRGVQKGQNSSKPASAVETLVGCSVNDRVHLLVKGINSKSFMYLGAIQLYVPELMARAVIIFHIKPSATELRFVPYFADVIKIP